MAPPANYLTAKEEEWRDIFNRLSERFPTVPGARVAQALREHNGHAGEAAAILRDLTGSSVKQADPDDVEHVATLLSSPPMFKHACKEQFRKYDVNKDGALEWEEIKNLVQGCFEEFGLPLPSEGSVKAFFFATDENQDGVLSEREFRKFFEMFLRYAFFDHLKLRAMVEKGQAIELQRASLKSVDGAPKAPTIPEESSDCADTSTPPLSRGSSAPSESQGSKENKEPPPQPPTVLAPLKSASEATLPLAELKTKASDRRRPASGKEKDPERSHRREHRSHRQDKDKEREQQVPGTGDSFGPTVRCLAPNGVAYRASANFQDRLDNVTSKGQNVQVLEHWVRTPDGWLPVMDAQGQKLFGNSSDADDAGNGNSNHKKHHKQVSIQDQQKDNKDDTLDVNIRSHRSASSPTKSRNDAAEGGASGLKSSEEEWRPVFERLSERFPTLSQDKIVQALRDNDGHAGKAASMLRYM